MAMAPRAVLNTLLVVVLAACCTLQAAESTETAYEEVLQAIDNWIETIPADHYKAVEGNQVFQWKVGLEKTPVWGPEKFLYYTQLLEEIGGKEFVYEHYKFNEKSIRYYQFRHYAEYYLSTPQPTISPVDFFTQQYKFYKGHINSRNEQWVWLDGFFLFLGGYYGDSQEDFVHSLASNCYTEVISVVEQYLLLSDYMLNYNPDVIMNYNNYYSSYTVFASTASETDHVLGYLFSFVQRFNLKLDQTAKELILNFIIPKYQDNDFAIKLYAALK